MEIINLLEEETKVRNRLNGEKTGSIRLKKKRHGLLIQEKNDRAENFQKKNT